MVRKQGPQKLKDPAKNEWVIKSDLLAPGEICVHSSSMLVDWKKKIKSDKKIRQRQIVFFQLPTATYLLIKHRHGTF